jgi:predicted ArsR family transcriptional regulator
MTKTQQIRNLLKSGEPMTGADIAERIPGVNHVYALQQLRYMQQNGMVHQVGKVPAKTRDRILYQWATATRRDTLKDLATRRGEPMVLVQTNNRRRFQPLGAKVTGELIRVAWPVK